MKTGKTLFPLPFFPSHAVVANNPSALVLVRRKKNKRCPDVRIAIAMPPRTGIINQSDVWRHAFIHCNLCSQSARCLARQL